jgi:hypothetical protein
VLWMVEEKKGRTILGIIVIFLGICAMGFTNKPLAWCTILLNPPLNDRKALEQAPAL